MDPAKALNLSYKWTKEAGFKLEDLNVRNFLQYAPRVAYIVKNWDSARRRRNKELIADWGETWKRLYGEFDYLVERDPMMVYQPANYAIVTGKLEAHIVGNCEH